MGQNGRPGLQGEKSKGKAQEGESNTYHECVRIKRDEKGVDGTCGEGNSAGCGCHPHRVSTLLLPHTYLLSFQILRDFSMLTSIRTPTCCFLPRSPKLYFPSYSPMPPGSFSSSYSIRPFWSITGLGQSWSTNVGKNDGKMSGWGTGEVRRRSIGVPTPPLSHCVSGLITFCSSSPKCQVKGVDYMVCKCLEF